MNKNKNLMSTRASTADYTGDYYWANVLAKKVQNYWHRLGYTKVRAWVETENTPSGNKFYSVRSNIKFPAFDIDTES